MTKVALYIALVLVCCLASVTQATQCRGLALQGGGDRGAYHVGMFNAMFELLNKEDYAYDVVTGVSVGALNGAGFSMFEKGQEKEANDFLRSVWDTISKKDIYKHWKPLGILTGFFKRSGLFNNAPLYDLLRVKFDKNIKRKFTWGIADAVTGKYVPLDEQEVTETSDIIDGVVASAAIPAFFPHSEIR